MKKRMTRLRRIVSGGQTGVDRAAHDAAMGFGLEIGGWCPRGRVAEDGVIPARYRLQETPAVEYAQRTLWNIRDSHGTLILHCGPMNGGTALTADIALYRGKPLLCIDLKERFSTARFRRWLAEHEIEVLNVAGLRESEEPGIGDLAGAMLRRLFGSVAGEMAAEESDDDEGAA